MNIYRIFLFFLSLCKHILGQCNQQQYFQNSICIPCPVGAQKISDTTKSGDISQCSICLQDYFMTATSITGPSPQAAKCQICPTGTGTGSVQTSVGDISSCNTCQPAYFMTKASSVSSGSAKTAQCVECPSGSTTIAVSTVVNDQSQCKKCKIEYYMTDEANPSNQWAAKCVRCPQGSLCDIMASSVTNLGYCNTCDQNYYATELPSNQISPIKPIQCQLCPNNSGTLSKSQNLSDASSCNICQSNFYMTQPSSQGKAATCVQCPMGCKTSSVQTQVDNISQCNACLQGYYLVSPAVQGASPQAAQCQKCPDCNKPNAINWTDYCCQYCTPDLPYATLDHKKCIQGSQSCNSIKNWDDASCQLCFSSNPYATKDKTACVASSQSCSSNSSWVDADCLLCSPLKPFANISQTDCVASSQSCSSSSNQTDFNCQLCNISKPYASADGINCLNLTQMCNSITQQWTDSKCQLCNKSTPYASTDGKNCFNQTQMCSTTTQQWTDSKCQLCNPPNKFALTDGSKCVNTSQSCSSTQNWNDLDCVLCFPSKPYANKNQTTCVASQQSCQSSSNWQNIDCQLCSPSQPYASLDQKQCLNQKQLCSSIYLWTNSLCQLCFHSNQFASNDSSKCVNSSQTCNSTSNWKDQDCNLCFSSKPYATLDQTCCVASSQTCLSTSNWIDTDCQLCSPSKPYASNDGKNCQTSPPLTPQPKPSQNDQNQQLFVDYKSSTFTQEKIEQIQQQNKQTSQVVSYSSVMMSSIQNIGSNSSFGIVLSALTIQKLTYILLIKKALPQQIYISLKAFTGQLPSQQFQFMNIFQLVLKQDYHNYQDKNYEEKQKSQNILIVMIKDLEDQNNSFVIISDPLTEKTKFPKTGLCNGRLRFNILMKLLYDTKKSGLQFFLLLQLCFMLIYLDDQPIELLINTLENLKQMYGSDQIIVAVGFKERTTDKEDKVNQLKLRFSKVFEELIITIHPYGIEGEIPGKCLNCNYIQRQLVIHLQKTRTNFDINEYMLTNFDTDTRFQKNYLQMLEQQIKKICKKPDCLVTSTLLQLGFEFKNFLCKDNFFTQKYANDGSITSISNQCHEHFYFFSQAMHGSLRKKRKLKSNQFIVQLFQDLLKKFMNGQHNQKDGLQEIAEVFHQFIVHSKSTQPSFKYNLWGLSYFNYYALFMTAQSFFTISCAIAFTVFKQDQLIGYKFYISVGTLGFQYLIYILMFNINGAYQYLLDPIREKEKFNFFLILIHIIFSLLMLIVYQIISFYGLFEVIYKGKKAFNHIASKKEELK
ncbi:hypothetical protein ABPG72_012160 [Tetrahymena utriculariae]